LIPLFDKKNEVTAPSAENWPQCSAKAIHISGIHISGLTGKDSIPHKVAMTGNPHKVAMTGNRAIHLFVDRGSTRANARAPHASSD
jgi:hypothetical protein